MSEDPINRGGCREKGSSLGAEVISDLGDHTLAALLVSWCPPPQAPGLMAIPVPIPCLFDSLFLYVTVVGEPSPFLTFDFFWFGLWSLFWQIQWAHSRSASLPQPTWQWTPSWTILYKILHIPLQSTPFLYMIYPCWPYVIQAFASLLFAFFIIMYYPNEQGPHLLRPPLCFHKGVHLSRNKF